MRGQEKGQTISPCEEAGGSELRRDRASSIGGERGDSDGCGASGRRRKGKRQRTHMRERPYVRGDAWPHRFVAAFMAPDHAASSLAIGGWRAAFH